MDNYNDFVGKKVKITVAFAACFVNAGPAPKDFEGIVKSINDDNIILSGVSTTINKGFSKSETINVNNMLINKKYIILIEEI